METLVASEHKSAWYQEARFAEADDAAKKPRADGRDARGGGGRDGRGKAGADGVAAPDRSQWGKDQGRSSKGGRERGDRGGGNDRDIVREKPMALSTAENAWKPSAKANETLPRLHDLKRTINGLLNKVCPENVATIIDKVAEIELRELDELELLIQLIFKKALGEPHYCETYADMVFELKKKMPEFTAVGSEKKVTFKAALLNTCQSEFEALPTILKLDEEDSKLTDLEEINFIKSKKKARVLANMKFIGQLFLRSLLSAKIIGSVIQDLTNCEQAEVLPEEPMIECICELLANIGYTLESTPVGKSSLTSVCGRLLDLKKKELPNGRGAYSKRIQFSIQDVMEMRKAGWTRKTHKATAKTKDEIRKEQEREIAATARGKVMPAGEVLVAGQRPAYIANNQK